MSVRFCAVILAFGLVSGFSLSAFAGGSVIFSYEKVEVGGDVQWTLVPNARKDLFGTPNASKIKRAFAALKKAKRSTYRGSALKVSGTGSKAKVSVNIDPKVAQYKLIIIAEVVYTLTEMGVTGVSFPGYAEGLVTRADLPFPGYMMVVPLWRAVPSLAAAHAMVVLPGGSMITAKDFNTRWKAKDAELLANLYSYLQAKDAYTVTSVAKLLPEQKIPYMEQLIPLLKDNRKQVRESVLPLLEAKRNDKLVLDAVVALVAAEKEADLALAGAEFLGKAKDKSYKIQREFYFLEKGDEKQAVAAINAMTKFKDERVLPLFVESLTDKRLSVAAAAAVGLGTLGDSASQIALLKKSKVNSDIRLDVARELSKDKVPANKLIGLSYVVLNSAEDESTMAVKAVGAVKGDESRAILEDYLSHKKRWIRRTSADQLVEINNVGSIAAFAKVIKKKLDTEYMQAAAYDVMVGQKVNVILEQANVRDSISKRIAYTALGERAQKEKKASNKVFRILDEGLSDRDVMIRGASARAIGSFANAKAAKSLKKVLKDKSADVRADVAIAMGKFKGAELLTELNAYLDDKSPKVQAAAVQSLGQRGEAGAWKRIKEMAKSEDPGLRAAGLVALATLVAKDDKQGVREVISILGSGVTDSNVKVQIAAVTALGKFKSDAAVSSIALHLGSDDTDLRIAAIHALGSTGFPTAVELLTTVADDADKKIRLATIEALKDLDAKAALEDRLKKEKDPELVALIRKNIK